MISNDLFDTLETEFKELIEKIESDVLELENSKNPAIIHSIFRSIHTIKGNSAMVGMNRLRDISHSLETLFSKIRSGETELKTEMIEIVLKSTDRIKEIILDLKNESNYQVIDLVVVLNKFLDKENKEILGKTESKEDYTNFIETAKKESKFLSVVDIDFTLNTSLTLGEWVQKFQTIELNILGKGIKEKEIPILSQERLSYSIPYFIILLSDESPEIFLKKHNISYSKIDDLYKPENVLNEIQIQSEKEKNQSNSYLKVPTKVIDDLINLAGEAVIARNQLFRSLNLEEDSEEEIRMNRVSQFINGIYNRLMNVRLQKLGSIFPRLQRVTRDASKSVGKEVKLYLEGQDIELDEVVIEGITESLMHIIRNSIDHGIESSSERVLLGKKNYGEIFLKASLQGGNILIEIKDDGRGLNRDKIKKKALEKQLITDEEAHNITEDKIADLIFLPGFSTSEKVTEVSGRGVGMDVVLTNFKRFGGSLRIETQENKGTKILGIIPQTLSVMPAFIISVLGVKFALLQKYIVELNKYSTEDILILENRKVYKKEDKLFPLIDLGELLFPNMDKQINYESIAVIRTDEKVFAISFDYLIAIEEIVLKPVPEKIKDIDLFGAVTVSGDGSAILLLEPEGILKFSKLHLEKTVIANNVSQKNKITNTSYLIFETSNQYFLTEASEIQHVWQIKKDQIEFIFEKEMIQLDGILIPSFRLESFFNIKQADNNEDMFCLIIQNSATTKGILAHNLVDMLDSIEIQENNVILNEYVEGVFMFDGKSSLYVKPSRILTEKTVGVI